jgi:hypothetical protein
VGKGNLPVGPPSSAGRKKVALPAYFPATLCKVSFTARLSKGIARTTRKKHKSGKRIRNMTSGEIDGGKTKEVVEMIAFYSH